MKQFISRRTILRGAGVALTLPFMESLLPRTVSAADAVVPIRYMPIYLPNGAPEFWVPDGTLTSWNLGSILAPLADLKAKVSVIKNLENGSAFNKSGDLAYVEPSHGRQSGAWLTSVDPASVKARLKTTQEANGVSVDQIMAAHAAFKGKTPIDSLQIGLTSIAGECDQQQCSNSQSVSWRTELQPTYKMVDPLTVFNALTKAKGGSTGTDPAELARRVALKKSVLDTALESATTMRGRLSKADQSRMDEFLDALRATELKATQVSTGMGGLACELGAAPTMKNVKSVHTFQDGIGQNTATYNKGDHADAMNALITIALQCDLTRIVTYMLEDERSIFKYDHVKKANFKGTSSGTATDTNSNCGEYHNDGQHGQDGKDTYASITRWNVLKVAELAKKLDAVKEANGKSVLDNTVIFFGGCMHADDHRCEKLPTLLIGSAGGKLKTGQYLNLTQRPLRDLHITMMNKVFDMAQPDFGQNLTGAPLAPITEIVA